MFKKFFYYSIIQHPANFSMNSMTHTNVRYRLYISTWNAMRLHPRRVGCARINKFAVLWMPFSCRYIAYHTWKRVTATRRAAGVIERRIEDAHRKGGENEARALLVHARRDRATQTSILLSVTSRKCWIYDGRAHTLSSVECRIHFPFADKILKILATITFLLPLFIFSSLSLFGR